MLKAWMLGYQTWVDAKKFRQYKRGFSLAMCSHYLEAKPISYLQMLVDEGTHLDLYTPFDAGIEEAIHVIKHGKPRPEIDTSLL